MIEFFITRVSGGFEHKADDGAVDVFASEAYAADMAVRFAQYLNAPVYIIVYP